MAMEMKPFSSAEIAEIRAEVEDAGVVPLTRVMRGRLFATIEARDREIAEQVAKRKGFEAACDLFIDDIAKLKQERDRAESARETFAQDRAVFAQERDAAIERTKELEAALERYGHHAEDCNVERLRHEAERVCNCGLDAVFSGQAKEEIHHELIQRAERAERLEKALRSIKHASNRTTVARIIDEALSEKTIAETAH